MNRIEIPVMGAVTSISWLKDGRSLFFSCNRSVFKFIVGSLLKQKIYSAVKELRDVRFGNDSHQEAEPMAEPTQERIGSIIPTDLDFDVCACNPKYNVVAFAQGRHQNEEERKKDNKWRGSKFVGGLISIRKLSDFSVISDFIGPAGVRNLRWSADGTKIWALCADETMVQGELPVAFRKE